VIALTDFAVSLNGLRDVDHSDNCCLNSPMDYSDCQHQAIAMIFIFDLVFPDKEILPNSQYVGEPNRLSSFPG